MHGYGQAYDFEVFQSNIAEKKATIIELPDLESRRKTRYNQKLKFWAICYSAFFIAGLGVGGFLFSQAKLAEYTYYSSVVEKKLEEFKSQNEQLQVQLASSAKIKDKENDKSIPKEDYVEVITLSTSDKAELN